MVALDTGIKLSILRQFRERGARVTLLPCTAAAQEVLDRDPDLVFLANGPGDPAALDYVVANVRELVGKKPVVGICLGHQLLCRAVGLETFKLPFGHRGANHPVKELETGRIEITSQNHGFAVATPDGSGRIEGDEPVRWDTDFGARGALPPEPLRPHGRGPRAEGRAGPDRPVPPGGRPGAARRAAPVRRVPGAGGVSRHEELNAAFDAVERRDFDFVRTWFEEHTHPDVEFSSALTSEIEGVYRGHNGLVDWARDVMDAVQITYGEREFVDVGDDIVVMLVRPKLAGRGSGVEIPIEVGFVVEFEGELVRRGASHRGHAEALAAAAEAAAHA